MDLLWNENFVWNFYMWNRVSYKFEIWIEIELNSWGVPRTCDPCWCMYGMCCVCVCHESFDDDVHTKWVCFLIFVSWWLYDGAWKETNGAWVCLRWWWPIWWSHRWTRLFMKKLMHMDSFVFFVWNKSWTRS